MPRFNRISSPAWLRGALAIVALLVVAFGHAGAKPAAIHSLGIIAALGDTCMFERVPDRAFQSVAPPEASFLEISDWGIDDSVEHEIARFLGGRVRVQSIDISQQDFGTWTYESLGRHIRELPLPETPVDAYLLILRDWRSDEIGRSDHQVGGLGLYRRDFSGGSKRFGVFASYRLLLANPDTGEVIAEVPALLPNGKLPWLPAVPSLWPPTQNDLTDVQRLELRTDFLKLIGATLPFALRKLGLQTR